MNTLNEKDEKILKVLAEHGNWSYKQISLQTEIPTTTVHNRIKKMEKDGVIRKYTVDIDNQKTGRPMVAHILVRINMTSWKTLSQFLKDELKGDVVKEFSRVTGHHDFIIKVNFSDMNELEHFIFRMVTNNKIHQTVTLISFAENS